MCDKKKKKKDDSKAKLQAACYLEIITDIALKKTDL